MTLSIIAFCIHCCSAERHLCQVIFMLRVVNKPFIQIVVMQNVVLLNVVMLNVIMLSVVMLNVVMLSVVMLSVVMLNVVAPLRRDS
jgi:hypothetical protein